MLSASIDIGSNSILLLILDISHNGTYREIANESRVTSLGKDLDKYGVFCEQSLNDSASALSDYCEILKSHNIDLSSVIVTATEAARVAKNASQFFLKIKSELGLSIKIITGEGEAYYTALGVSRDISSSQGSIVVMDIGGASTELIEISKKDKSIEIVSSKSMPVGSVRATDWLMESETLFENKLSNVLTKDIKKYKTKKIVCVAGTMTSVAAMILGLEQFKADLIHNSTYTKNDIVELCGKYSSASREKILEDFPFLGKRSATIVGGIRAVLKIFDFLDVEEFVLSTYGLRYGVLFDGGLNERYIK